MASLVFVGQAVARQVRLEWRDAPTLTALGMSRSSRTLTAAVRSLPLMIVAVSVAAIVSIAMSPLGPIGVARAAETEPGVAIDWTVLAVGLPAVAVCVLLFAIVPAAASDRQRATRPLASRSRAGRSLSPTGVAGWAMTRSRRAGDLALGSAVIGVALASAAGIAAWTLTSSYDELAVSPGRYGVSWDVQVGNVGSVEQETQTQARLSTVDGIRAVGIKSTNTLTADPAFIFLSFSPFIGEVQPAVIVDGRPPVADNEIALGQQTMAALGVGVGDVASIPLADGETTPPFTVVGEVVLNDGMTARPGLGALVTEAAFDELSVGTLGQSYAVWFDEGPDAAATERALLEAFPTSYVPPHPSRQVSNLGLVSGQPAIVALTIGMLAGAALVHALVMSVRRSRRQIGVLQSLGFTRGQVTSCVAWHASLIATASLVVGVPLGIVAGRVAWRAISDTLGVSSPPALPVGASVAVAIAVVVVANLAALGPGLLASRCDQCRRCAKSECRSPAGVEPDGQERGLAHPDELHERIVAVADPARRRGRVAQCEPGRLGRGVVLVVDLDVGESSAARGRDGDVELAPARHQVTHDQS